MREGTREEGGERKRHLATQIPPSEDGAWAQRARSQNDLTAAERLSLSTHHSTLTRSLNTSGGFDKKAASHFLASFPQASSTPWQAAGLSTTTSCHYTDYYPCQSHAPPTHPLLGAGKEGGWEDGLKEERESKGSGRSDGGPLRYSDNERNKHDCQHRQQRENMLFLTNSHSTHTVKMK